MTDRPPNPALKVFGVEVPITPRGITLSLLFLAAGTGGPLMLASSVGLATSAEVQEMRASIPTVDVVRAEYAPRLDALDERVTAHDSTIAAIASSTKDMQESIWEGRAEMLAREVADKEQDAARRLRVREIVYDRALSNLRRGNPIHDGLVEYELR